MKDLEQQKQRLVEQVRLPDHEAEPSGYRVVLLPCFGCRLFIIQCNSFSATEDAIVPHKRTILTVLKTILALLEYAVHRSCSYFRYYDQYPPGKLFRFLATIREQFPVANQRRASCQLAMLQGACSPVLLICHCRLSCTQPRSASKTKTTISSPTKSSNSQNPRWSWNPRTTCSEWKRWGAGSTSLRSFFTLHVSCLLLSRFVLSHSSHDTTLTPGRLSVCKVVAMGCSSAVNNLSDARNFHSGQAAIHAHV